VFRVGAGDTTAGAEAKQLSYFESEIEDVIRQLL
jgi:hypothetical protein